MAEKDSPDTPSCIASQFAQFIELSEFESELLNELERDIQDYPAGSTLQEPGRAPCYFFALKSGWACANRLLLDGQRQILDIYLPGQVMGLHEIGMANAQSGLVALTDIQACPFPRERLRKVFHEAPRLTEVFFLVLAREHALITERIVNIGRRPAGERLAHFLLELQARIDPSEPCIELPMTQPMIGDALGMSAVHVSRSLSALREEGLIDANNGHIRLCDREALVELASFDQGYLDFRRHWLENP